MYLFIYLFIYFKQLEAKFWSWTVLQVKLFQNPAVKYVISISFQLYSCGSDTLRSFSCLKEENQHYLKAKGLPDLFNFCQKALKQN